ncbi:MAG: TRZ/ATZ family hydrolase, partial [Xanthomonadales bacterium]|nr:TRZ/ATZ family hydrolase [Xanthomonadales bacterium]
LYDVVSQLVYASSRHQVSDVWIDGERKLAARELVGTDVPALLAKTRAWGDRIRAM